MSLSRCFYGARDPIRFGTHNGFQIYQSVIQRKISNCIFGVLSESPLLRRVITKSWNLSLLEIFWQLLKWQGRLFKMLCDCFFWTRTFLPGEWEAPKTCSRNSWSLGCSESWENDKMHKFPPWGYMSRKLFVGISRDAAFTSGTDAEKDAQWGSCLRATYVPVSNPPPYSNNQLQRTH